jgi:glutamate-1-semialdehyde 2,1-aminomutase
MERTLVQPLDPAEAQRKAFHSGTFQSNLIGLVAGLAVIGELEKPGVLERINGYGDTIRDGLRASADRFGLNLLTGGFGSIVSFHFGDAPVRNMREVAASDRDAAATFCLGLIANGIFITTYHLGLTNGAQTDADIDFVLDVAADVFEKMSS